MIAENSPDSHSQIQRYIRLTELIQPLLDLVDEGRIALRPAVELSYLTKEEQEDLVETISYTDATPSLAQAIKMRRLSANNDLDAEVMDSILSEQKPNQKEKFSFKADQLRQYIPKSVPYEKTGDYVLKALEFYQRYQEQQKSKRDAR